MKKITLGLMLMVGVVAFAQDKPVAEEGRFQIGVHFAPSLQSSTFTGVAGASLRYKVITAGPVDLNAGFNANYLTADNNSNASDIVILNPNITAELNVFDFGLKPYLGIGYDFYTVKYEFVNVFAFEFDPAFDSDGEAKRTFSGFNVNLGARYFIKNAFFVDAGYNYIRATSSDPGNWVFHMANIGIGFRF
ncbi:MAG TPA: outer membrane beta-barrel protein [Flavobacterium sp.]|nr:outer membrane beta-barrel protein [Flavobacterium sp.]